MKVLHVVTRVDVGGISTWLYNYYSHIDHKIIQFDIVAIDTGKKHNYHNDLEGLGIKIHYMPNKISSRILYFKKLILQNTYDIIHCHCQLPSAIYLLIAKFSGIRVRIVHSHLAVKNIGLKDRLLRFLLNQVASHKFAASVPAGLALFGDKSFNNFLIINNAIDAEKFIFNEHTRSIIRNKLNIDEYIILGFVGRLTYLKNIHFLLDIVKSLKNVSAKCKLLVVGDGELRSEFNDLSRKLDISNDIIMLGNVKDVEKYMMGMDVLLLPSFSEGLSLVLVEAQAAALYCLASKNRVPSATKLTNYVEFISIEDGTDIWRDKILEIGNYNRIDVSKQIIANSYDIKTEAQKLQKFYQSSLVDLNR